MLSKRIISCLDVRDGKLAKSVKFLDTKDIGDPVAQARKYYEQGLDELVFYDITASNENRNILIDVVNRVAEQVFIPFSVEVVCGLWKIAAEFSLLVPRKSMSILQPSGTRS